VWPGVIYVVDELDYEQKQQYELTIRATDGVFPVYAEVLVSILVQDVNDCPPEFTQDAYNISVSEAAPFGTSVLKVVSRDNDTGIMFKVIWYGFLLIIKMVSSYGNSYYWSFIC
jgi:protocadherin Fat 1/2/3